MNRLKTSSSLRMFAFRAQRAIVTSLPGGCISTFGKGDDKIGAIVVLNLDRKPLRLRRVLRELRRFRTSEGAPLTTITQRFAAVDARDGCAVAATGDVDPSYCIGDQLYVQPDARLQECFGIDEQITMTRQEVAVARSHVEVWKAIATGPDNYVLVLEDDIWFKSGAAAAIDCAWRAARQHCKAEGAPHLLYLSYSDAGGTLERHDLCNELFRPARGLWFLSGYVLSRKGASALLRAMPVIGPVDMWINYRFKELGALAISSPVIMQRHDSASDNSYSVLPYLARAGVVDAGSGPMRPDRARAGPVIAWTARGECERLAMALSMLGLRVRVFDREDDVILAEDMPDLCEVFDAFVDAPLSPAALVATIARKDTRFLVEENAAVHGWVQLEHLPSSRTAFLSPNGSDSSMWASICTLLKLPRPNQTFPFGTSPAFKTFRDDRPKAVRWQHHSDKRKISFLDDSPWVLPPRSRWRASPPSGQPAPPFGQCLIHEQMTTFMPCFRRLVETFPSNLASFSQDGILHDSDGAHLVISKTPAGNRSYRSGAFATLCAFGHGRFQAEIRAAFGSGIITGFFLHRDAPRQEIDIEIAGNDPKTILVNVYFNPGDDGAAMSFGYRGSPCRIDLGFDATAGFHLYTIDWRPGRIVWSVDGAILHERVSWDPTPIPYLPMHLHANLWAPRSEELAGRTNDDAFPARATFRNISVHA
jgi:GR25 family glycosyltransferase involved in LPS biosynthesis